MDSDKFSTTNETGWKVNFFTKSARYCHKNVLFLFYIAQASNIIRLFYNKITKQPVGNSGWLPTIELRLAFIATK